MSTLTNSSITLTDVGFRWPDGVTALSDITGSFGVGRTGLVGSNGAGKSTLLRLIAGRLVPTTGTIVTSGDVAYLPQTLTLEQGSTIAELLGVDAKLTAMRAIESGDVDGRHFDVLGDDWDIETRAGEALREIGFTAADVDRSGRRASPAGRPCSPRSRACASSGPRSRCSTSRRTTWIGMRGLGSPGSSSRGAARSSS